MHYNAVQNTVFVECSVLVRKNELNSWKSSVKLKHSYYIESKRSNMPGTEIETIRIYVLVFHGAIRSNIREISVFGKAESWEQILDKWCVQSHTPYTVYEELNFVLRAVILLHADMFLILKCWMLPKWFSYSK